MASQDKDRGQVTQQRGQPPGGDGGHALNDQLAPRDVGAVDGHQRHHIRPPRGEQHSDRAAPTALGGA